MVGDRIRITRVNSGLSQQGLAKKMGAAQTTVSGWENGQREPDIATLHQIAENLGGSYSYLVGAQNEPEMLRLRELRKDWGASRRELAKLSSVSEGIIAALEDGKFDAAPTDQHDKLLEALDCLSDFFEVSLDYMLGESEFRDAEEEGLAYAEAYGPVLDHFDGDLNKWRAFKQAEADDAMRDAAEEQAQRRNGNWFPSNAIPLEGEFHQIPVLGSVCAGVGGLAVEELEYFEAVPKATIKGSVENHFFLRVSGDSMSPEIQPGDLVLVRKQQSVDSGQIAVVCIDGEEGVVKKIRYSHAAVDPNTPESYWIVLESVNPVYPPRSFVGIEIERIYVVGLVVQSMRKY